MLNRKELFPKRFESSLNGSLLFYQIQMSSFWGCLLILYLQPIAPILPGLEEDHSCLLKGSTRNCCKQEICGPSEYGDTPETWLQRIYLPSKSRFFLLSVKKKKTKAVTKNLPLLTIDYHHISNEKPGISQYLPSTLQLHYRYFFRILSFS